MASKQSRASAKKTKNPNDKSNSDNTSVIKVQTKGQYFMKREVSSDSFKTNSSMQNFNIYTSGSVLQ